MIALADQRSFYASTECVFRPDLRGKPVAVLSNNDGCVVAMNAPAKAVGVKKFLPYFQQRELMDREGVTVFSSNYELIGEVSRRIMATIAELAPNPNIEVYSVDECFIDFEGVVPAQLKPVAQQLRDAVWRTQRIEMGVSVAPTKTLAKLGQEATKALPQLNGVCVLEHPHQWQWLANRLAVSDVWGVGRQLTKKLNSVGVISAADLAALPRQQALELQGVTLARTVAELNGTPCIALEQVPPAKQQIICSRSFGQKLTALDDLKQAVTAFAERGGQKLRRQDSIAQGVTTFIQTGRHIDNPYNNQRAGTLYPATSDSRHLAQAALTALEAVYRKGYRYAKAGIILHGVEPADKRGQMDCFTDDSPRSASLMNTLDAINHRYGQGMIALARQCGAGRFSMRRDMKSPSYLTRWSDIPTLAIK